MVLQPLLETDFSTLQTLLEAMQIHASSKEYAIVKRRSKSSYKFSKIIKIAIDCERDDYLRKKSNTKQKRIDNIKIDCLFRINALYKESLNI